MTTWNPADARSTLVFSNGNKTVTWATGGQCGVRSTTVKTTGKHYFEVYNVNDKFAYFGIDDGAMDVSADNPLWWTHSFGYYGGDGNVYSNFTTVATGLPQWSIGDIIMVALDITGGKIYFGRNGTWLNSGNPVAGTGGITLHNGTGNYYAAASCGFNSAGTGRWSPADQTYAAPSGFSAWDANSVIPPGASFVPGHAFLTNMLACYLPGVYGGVPVSGTGGPTLSNGSGGAGTTVTTIEGPALRSNTLGSSRGLIGTAPTAFKSWTNFTTLWRGVLLGNCDGYCPLVGMSSSDGSAQPYLILSATTDAGGYTQAKAGYGDAGTFEATSTTDVTGTYGSIVDFAVTATVGGNVTFYINGVSVATGSLTTIATSGSTAQIIINQDINSQNRSSNASVNMACYWDRALSSTEILNLHNDPYQFLQGGPPTGTLAATEAQDTAVFAGTVPIDFQFLGVGTVVEVTAVSHTLSLTGIAARQPGDLLVACIGSRTTSTTSVTLPSGWTLVNEQKANNTLTTTGAIASGVMAYHVRGASDPALGFTHPSGISVARGTIVAYRPLTTVSLDTSRAATTATNTTAVSVTGLTTAAATELLVYQAVGGQEATWTNFDAATDPTTTSGTGSAQTADPIPGTWQERSDTNTTSGADMSLGIADAIKATAGATGNFTATASLGAGHVVIVGAFKLAAAPVTGTLAATEAQDTAAIVAGPVIPASPAFVPGHSLLTNMLACYLPGVLGGAPVSGTGPTLANGAGGAGTVVSTLEGPASRSNTLGSARGLIATAPSAFKTWTNFTVLWRGLLIGTGDNFCPVVGVSIGDTDVSPYFMLNVSSGAASYGDVKSYYGDATASETTGASDATGQYGKIVDFAATATVGGNVTFYVNGVAIGTTGSLTTISTSSGTSKIVVNQGIDATNRSPNASVTMAAFWDRALSGAEVLALHNNPYGFLQTSTGSVMPAAAGSYVLTGTAATLRKGKVLAATTAGAYALTGTAATLIRGRILAATTAGAYALTGAATTALLRGRKIAATTAGAYALTGTAAALLFGHKIAATAAGAYALTGTPAALIKAANRTLVANSGNYALTGTAAALIRGRILAATTAGAYALTGTAVTLRKGKVLAATTAGAYALTGTAATLRKGKLLVATTGAYALTGTAVALIRGRTLAATTPGVYALTGSPVTLAKLLDRTLVAGAGTYTLTGAATTALERSRILVATTAGAYALTGTAVTLTKRAALTLAANAGSYALTGASTTALLIPHKLDATAGAYALTGAATTALKRSRIFVATTPGAYALTGSPVTLTKLTPRSLVAGAGAYALTGAATTALLRGRKTAATTAGAYALTGTAVTLTKLRNFKLAADAGAYALTGASTTALKRNWIFVATTPGTYALTGDTATQLRKATANIMLATSGIYSLTGTTVGLRHSWTIKAGYETVTWDPATIASVVLSNGNLTATNTGTTSANQGARGKTWGLA